MDLKKLDLDVECLNLCLALNKIPGITTTESCCGHGKRPFRIWFRVKNLDALDKLAFWLDHRFNGGLYWSMQVMTETGYEAGVIFFVESESIGQPAFDEANKLADLLEGEFSPELREKLYVEWLETRGIYCEEKRNNNDYKNKN